MILMSKIFNMCHKREGQRKKNVTFFTFFFYMFFLLSEKFYLVLFSSTPYPSKNQLIFLCIVFFCFQIDTCFLCPLSGILSDIKTISCHFFHLKMIKILFLGAYLASVKKMLSLFMFFIYRMSSPFFMYPLPYRPNSFVFSYIFYSIFFNIYELNLLFLPQTFVLVHFPPKIVPFLPPPAHNTTQ